MKLASAYPISLICQVLDYPRSSYYYQPREGDEAEIETAIDQVAESWPKYGYRRLTVHLRREKGLAVNSKRPAPRVIGWGLPGLAGRFR